MDVSDCPGRCEQKICNKCCKPCKPCGYVQPPRPKSFKPEIEYFRPITPMEVDSVYKQSYNPIDACVMMNSRAEPIIQKDNHVKPTGKMENETVTNLSYQGHYCVKPPMPIIPVKTKLMGNGYCHTETTQKHDFVIKPSSKRCPILPNSNIYCEVGQSEKDTVTKLSFLPVDVCQYPPPKSLKPICTYEKPSDPMESETVQKLSYVPVCPPAKEEYPWAAKKAFQLPTIPMEKNTTYNLSYMLNCGSKKESPIYPLSASRLFGDSKFSDDTVYKASYQPSCIDRPKMIRRQSALQLSGEPPESDTVYKMSFQEHCNPSKSMPIIPCPSSLRTLGPMSFETTQKHDFVPKPSSKRVPKIPKNSMMRPFGSFEKDTVNKLSYMAPAIISPAKLILPVNTYHKPEGPMLSETTHKLSFMPVCPPPKEFLPWAAKKTYQRPNIPMENSTIHKMSYIPPGNYIDGGNCCCKIPNTFDTFPKAAIVN